MLEAFEQRIGEQLREETVKLASEDWKAKRGMRKVLDQYRDEGAWWSFSLQAMKMKILYPNFDPGLDKKAWGLAWEKMIRQLDYYRGSDPQWWEHWWFFFHQAMAMKILNPQFDPGLDEKAWEGIRNLLEWFRRSNNVESFTWIAMAGKILNPEFDPGLDENAWIGIRRELLRLRREENWWDFGNLAMAVRILASRRIEIPPQGGLIVE